MEEPPSRTTPSVHGAASIDELRAALAHLTRQEATVTARLDALIASQNDLSRELGRLDLLRAQLGSHVLSARAIGHDMLADAASTAHRISGAVKRLDQEQANVKATLEVVEQVAELKACVQGVHGSMGAPQDWETAAGYLNRASRIPAEVIEGSFAQDIVPSAEIPDLPRVTLDQAAESLCGLFLREFEKATKEGDGTRVTRFFKLFPLIGRSDVGLDAYGRYVCQGVAARARTNLNAGTGGAQGKDGFFYAHTLTKLFEHIAQIVEGHQPLVERHYGEGMMVKVIERLQTEADLQGGIILDAWSEDRRVDRKLTDIKSYAFSFLVQSFMHAQKMTAGNTRSDSPLKRDGTPGPRSSEDEGVNMKEVDGILGEAAVMLERWALYTRFLASKSPVRSLAQWSLKGADHERQQPAKMNGRSQADNTLEMPTYLSNSGLQKKVTKFLIEPFNIMSTFFFRRSVEKAFQLDEPPQDLTLKMSRQLTANAPFITSAVDDVMYIMSQVLQRCLGTSQRAIVGTVVPSVGRVLGSDFIPMIQRKMRDESYPKAAIQGALPPEDKIIAFLVLINNLDIATEYLKRIIATHFDDPSEVGNDSHDVPARLKSLFPFTGDATFVVNGLRTVENAFTTKTNELLRDGIAVAFHQILKPRVRPMLADAFRDVDYNAALADDAGNDPADDDDADPDDEDAQADLVPRRFASAWAQLTRPIARLLTPRAFEQLLATTLPYLSAALEKRLWALHARVSELGAVRLERDVAGIVGAACGEGRYALRERFARCSQVCMVAGMEAEEWDALQDDPDDRTEWKLDAAERQRARELVAGRD